MLAKTKIHLRSEGDDDDLVFSPIADFGYFNDRTKAGNRDAGKATVYIRFNSLISQAILARGWRQINYERIIGSDIYLVRWLRKLLGSRFVYAAPNKTFNIMLSTIIESSGVTLCQRLSDNLKQVEQALKAMPDVIDRYHVEKRFAAPGTTAKGRRLDDAKIVLRPTQAFTVEQMKTNMHINRLDTAVIAEDGAVVVEPERHDFKNFMDYEHAKSKYQGGRRIAKTKT